MRTTRSSFLPARFGNLSSNSPRVTFCKPPCWNGSQATHVRLVSVRPGSPTHGHGLLVLSNNGPSDRAKERSAVLAQAATQFAAERDEAIKQLRAALADERATTLRDAEAASTRVMDRVFFRLTALFDALRVT
jgi:hypothetical protein